MVEPATRSGKEVSSEVIHTVFTGNIWRVLRTLAVAFGTAVLVVTMACGGDDDGDNPTNTEDASATAGGPTAIRTQGGTPVDSPAGTSGLPEICSEGEVQRGLLSRVDFSGDDGQFDEAEAIEITQTMTNCSETPVVLHYLTTQRYIVTIEDAETSVVVWDSAEGKSFAPVLGDEEIAPGGTQVFTETWDQTDASGDQVAKGEYKVSFFNVGCGQEAQSSCQFGSVKSIIIQ